MAPQRKHASAEVLLAKPSHQELKLRYSLTREILTEAGKRRHNPLMSTNIGKISTSEIQKQDRQEWRAFPRAFHRCRRLLNLYSLENLRDKYQDTFRSQIRKIEMVFSTAPLNSEEQHPTGGNLYPFIDKRKEFDMRCEKIVKTAKPDKIYHELRDIYEKMEKYLDKYWWLALFIEVHGKLGKRARKEGLNIDSAADWKHFKVDLEPGKPIVHLSPAISFDISKQHFVCKYHEDGKLKENIWLMAEQDQLNKRTQIAEEIMAAPAWEEPLAWAKNHQELQNLYNDLRIFVMINPAKPNPIKEDLVEIYQPAFNMGGRAIWKQFGPPYIRNQNFEYKVFHKVWTKWVGPVEWDWLRNKIPAEEYEKQLELYYRHMNGFLSHYFDKLLEEKVEHEYQKWLASTGEEVQELELEQGRVFAIDGKKVKISERTTASMVKDGWCDVGGVSQAKIVADSKKDEVFGLKPRAMFGDLIKKDPFQDAIEKDNIEVEQLGEALGSTNQVEEVVVVEHPEEAVTLTNPDDLRRNQRRPQPSPEEFKEWSEMTEKEQNKMKSIHYGPWAIPDRRDQGMNAFAGNSLSAPIAGEAVDEYLTSRSEIINAAAGQSVQQAPIMLPDSDSDDGPKSPKQPLKKDTPLKNRHYIEVDSDDDSEISDVDPSRLCPAEIGQMERDIAAARPQELAAVKRKPSRPRKNSLSETQPTQASTPQTPATQTSGHDGLQEHSVFAISTAALEAIATTHGERGRFADAPAPLRTGHPKGLQSGFRQPRYLQRSEGAAFRLRVPRPPLGPRPEGRNAYQKKCNEIQKLKAQQARDQLQASQKLSIESSTLGDQPAAQVNGPQGDAPTGKGPSRTVNQASANVEPSQLPPCTQADLDRWRQDMERRGQALVRDRLARRGPVPFIGDFHIAEEISQNLSSPAPNGASSPQMGGDFLRDTQQPDFNAFLTPPSPHRAGLRLDQTPPNQDCGRIVSGTGETLAGTARSYQSSGIGSFSLKLFGTAASTLGTLGQVGRAGIPAQPAAGAIPPSAADGRATQNVDQKAQPEAHQHMNQDPKPVFQMLEDPLPLMPANTPSGPHEVEGAQQAFNPGMKRSRSPSDVGNPRPNPSMNRPPHNSPTGAMRTLNIHGQSGNFQPQQSSSFQQQLNVNASLSQAISGYYEMQHTPSQRYYQLSSNLGRQPLGNGYSGPTPFPRQENDQSRHRQRNQYVHSQRPNGMIRQRSFYNYSGPPVMSAHSVPHLQYQGGLGNGNLNAVQHSVSVNGGLHGFPGMSQGVMSGAMAHQAQIYGNAPAPSDYQFGYANGGYYSSPWTPAEMQMTSAVSRQGSLQAQQIPLSRNQQAPSDTNMWDRMLGVHSAVPNNAQSNIMHPSLRTVQELNQQQLQHVRPRSTRSELANNVQLNEPAGGHARSQHTHQIQDQNGPRQHSRLPNYAPAGGMPGRQVPNRTMDEPQHERLFINQARNLLNDQQRGAPHGTGLSSNLNEIQPSVRPQAPTRPLRAEERPGDSRNGSYLFSNNRNINTGLPANVVLNQNISQQSNRDVSLCPDPVVHQLQMNDQNVPALQRQQLAPPIPAWSSQSVSPQPPLNTLDGDYFDWDKYNNEG
jgi:hypothetical protein